MTKLAISIKKTKLTQFGHETHTSILTIVFQHYLICYQLLESKNIFESRHLKI